MNQSLYGLMEVIVTDPRVLNADGSINQLTNGSEDAAGYDLVAWPQEPVTLTPGEAAVMIPTGIKLHIRDRNLVGMVYPRSGWGHKKGFSLGNTVGVVDADYQGEMFISAQAKGGETITINPGDRVAQIVFTRINHTNFVVVPEFTEDTERGAGGFGSSGMSVTNDKDVAFVEDEDPDGDVPEMEGDLKLAARHFGNVVVHKHIDGNAS